MVFYLFCILLLVFVFETDSFSKITKVKREYGPKRMCSICCVPCYNIITYASLCIGIVFIYEMCFQYSKADIISYRHKTKDIDIDGPSNI